MTKPFSVAFKQKMVQRLSGKNAVSASQLAREIGIRQQNLSRWLQEARSLPVMADKPKRDDLDAAVARPHPLVQSPARLRRQPGGFLANAA
jgi:transposase-like protein